MKNITENDINEIREIKEGIKNSELKLEKFMSIDLSNNEARKEMREILNSIEKMEAKLSTKLGELK